MPAESPYYRSTEAAAYCKVSLQTLYNHRREIRAVRTRPLLFTQAALDKWLSSPRKRRK
jgi:hypothetical protein